MESHKICEGKSVGKIVQSDCIKCDRNTAHKVLSDWGCITDYDPAQMVSSREDFQIIQCQGCDHLSFRSIYSFSEEEYFNKATGEWDHIETVKLYPSRAVGKLRIQRSDFHFLPPRVRRALEETHDAICMGNEILSGAGIRLLLEAVCQEQGCEGNLEKKIDQLVVKGFTTKTNAEILHILRDLGNASLHEMKIHTKEEIDISFIVIQNLLESVYIIPEKAERIKQKRDNEK